MTSGIEALRTLLEPRSVAIVGLSADPAKHGGRVLANLRKLGFAGEIWGVNPRRPDVPGTRVYERLAELPDAPEVVVCAVPSPVVADVVRDAGAAGAVAAIVFAGGFAEAGDDGRAAQDELREVARMSGVRLLGPNSAGVIAPRSGAALSFLTCLDRPAEEIRTGPVALATQSGGTGSYLHNLVAARGSGFAASISTGNEADLGVADAIAALAALEEAHAVAVVLETVRDGPAFVEAVRSSHRAGKPVVALRIGSSGRGARLMESHTGAMADDAGVLAGACDSLGVTVVETAAELVDVAETMARCQVPRGRRVGVVTHSGGTAILIADLAERSHLELPHPQSALRRRLEPLLDHGSAENPVDMGAIVGGPHRFGQVVEAFVDEADYDVVLAVSTPHPPAHTSRRVEGLVGLVDREKPVVHLWMAGDLGAAGLIALRAAGAAATEEPRAAVRAVAGLVRLHEIGAISRPVSPHAPPVRTEGRGLVLSDHEAKTLLAGWGVPVVAGDVASSPAEAVGIAESIGYPVALKVDAREVPHKTEIGGLLTGLGDGDAVESGFGELVETVRRTAPDVEIRGVRVERHRSGVEVIVGGVRDPTFGPVVLIGLGGLLAEAIGDVRLALAPVTPQEVRRLVSRLRGSGLLAGHRGMPATDIAALAEIVTLLSNRFVAATEVAEVEVNPLVWTGAGWEALDALVGIVPQ